MRRDSSSEGTNASPARDDGMTLNAENKPCLAGQHRQCYTMQTHYDVVIVKEIEIVLRGTSHPGSDELVRRAWDISRLSFKLELFLILFRRAYLEA